MRRLVILLLCAFPSLTWAVGYTYVSAGTYVNATGTLSPGQPAGKSSGNLLLLITGARIDSETATTPTGYTLLCDSTSTLNKSIAVYGRIATNNSSDNVSADIWSGTSQSFAQILAFSGDVYTDLATIVDACAPRGNTSSVANLPSQSMTVGANNELIIGTGKKTKNTTSDGLTATSPTGLSNRVTLDVPNGTNVWAVIDYTLQTTASNFSQDVWTQSVAESNSYASILLALKSGGAPSFSGTISTQSITEGTSVGTINFASFFTGATSYSVQSCTLPHSLSLNTGTGAVTGTPDQPLSVTGCVIRGTNSNGSADSNSFNWTMNPPSGKQYVTLASLDASSPCVLEINPVATPDIAVGDIFKIDLLTTPGGYSLTAGTDCTMSYGGSDSSRQLVTYDVWDTSVGAYMSGGPGNLWFNNQAPVAPVGETLFIVPYNQAMTPTDLSQICTDAEGDDQTVTNVDSLPAGLVLNGTGCTPSSNSCLHGTTTFKGVTPDVRLQCCDITGACTVFD